MTEPRASLFEARPQAQVGQVWEDAEGYLMRVVAVREDCFFVKPYRSPHSHPIQTHLSWLTEWTLTGYGS